MAVEAAEFAGWEPTDPADREALAEASFQVERPTRDRFPAPVVVAVAAPDPTAAQESGS